KMLFDRREKRSKPRLDDKCLTSWNAIMGKGFADAYKALNNTQDLEAAVQTANFIIGKLWSPDGNLFRNYKNGKATINGYLEDYAHVIDFFDSLYEITLDEQWLGNAKQLTDYCFEHFFDTASGFFRFTSRLDDELIVSHFETEDNVIAASNSAMANNLFKLSIYFLKMHYQSVCENMLRQIIPTVDYPSAFSNWLEVLLNFSDENRELAICGNDAKTYARKLALHYRPNIVIAAAESASSLPFLKNRQPEHGTLFYVCRGKTCQLPVDDFEKATLDL